MRLYVLFLSTKVIKVWIEKSWIRNRKENSVNTGCGTCAAVAERRASKNGIPGLDEFVNMLRIHTL